MFMWAVNRFIVIRTLLDTSGNMKSGPPLPQQKHESRDLPGIYLL